MSACQSLLRGSARLVQFTQHSVRPLVLSQTRSLASLCRPALPSPALHTTALCRRFATAGDSEVAKFLQEEIATEKKNARGLPKLEGWKVETDGAEVTLSKEVAGGEKVMVTLNVNHTVDSAQPDDGSEEVR